MSTKVFTILSHLQFVRPGKTLQIWQGELLWLCAGSAEKPLPWKRGFYILTTNTAFVVVDGSYVHS